jgi:hypothetical protein
MGKNLKYNFKQRGKSEGEKDLWIPAPGVSQKNIILCNMHGEYTLGEMENFVRKLNLEMVQYDYDMTEYTEAIHFLELIIERVKDKNTIIRFKYM